MQSNSYPNRWNLSILSKLFNSLYHFEACINGILNMAVPKSKISKSKKKIKKHRYNAKQIQWMRCDRCGEPKLPHRMCEEHKEMCMLADGDYEVYKVDQERKMKEMAEEE